MATIAICIPARGQMEVGTAFDLARMVNHIARNTEHQVNLYTSMGTLIFDQRNNMVESALEEGADYVLFIDADMRFPRDTLERLIAHGKGIVGVNATTRSSPVKATAKTLEIEAGGTCNWKQISSKNKTGIQKADGIGCGVMLISKETLNAMVKPWFFFELLPENKLLGEDIYFCIKAKDVGIDTYIDHDLSKEIGHVGNYTYGWHDIS
jgi:glycosyltransferase involved in cell wall biosynthesis